MLLCYCHVSRVGIAMRPICCWWFCSCMHMIYDIIAVLWRDNSVIEGKHTRMERKMLEHHLTALFRPSLRLSQSLCIYFRFPMPLTFRYHPHLLPRQHIFCLFVIFHQCLFNKNCGNSSTWLCHNLIKWFLFFLQASQTLPFPREIQVRALPSSILSST